MMTTTGTRINKQHDHRFIHHSMVTTTTLEFFRSSIPTSVGVAEE
jgi:hypothetical protein